MSKEAMTLALEALKHIHPSPLTSFYTIGDRDKAIKALEEALAKQEQELALQKLHDENERLGLYKDAYGEEHKESVRLQCVVCNTVYANGVPPQVAKQEKGEPLCTAAMFDDAFLAKSGLDPKTPLYTKPQPAQKPWVGLTDEEPDEIAAYYGLDCMAYGPAFRAIEAKLKEKNT